jgi:hypothetical protein
VYDPLFWVAGSTYLIPQTTRLLDLDDVDPGEKGASFVSSMIEWPDPEELEDATVVAVTSEAEQ